MERTTKRGTVGGAAVLLAAVSALSGCSGTGPGGAGVSASLAVTGGPTTSSEPSSSGASGASASDSPGGGGSTGAGSVGVAVAAPDPLAPATISPVRRGKAATKRTAVAGDGTTAKPAAFAAGARYSDGVSITVTKVARTRSEGTGPGAQPGVELADVTLEVTNGGTGDLALNGLVVTATYGSPPRLARRFYTDSSTDFAGTLAAGKRAEAHYIFAIPATSRRGVVLTVDLDGHHAPAVLRGNV